MKINPPSLPIIETFNSKASRECVLRHSTSDIQLETRQYWRIPRGTLSSKRVSEVLLREREFKFFEPLEIPI